MPANRKVFDDSYVMPSPSGGVVSPPAKAPMALMGEAGPEAIIPLRRGPDGKLGIANLNSGHTPHGGGIVVNAPITVNGVQSGPNGIDPHSLKKMQSQLHGMVHGAVMDVLTNQSRPGGTIYNAANGMGGH